MTRALADLIARVKGLTGPDREVDKLVEDTLWPNTHFLPFNPNPNDWLVEIGEKWVETVRYPRGVMTNKDRYVSRYTASIDAVVALIERELPGWAWSLHSWAVAAICEEWKPAKHTPFEKWKPEPKAATPALALLLAFLRALEASRTTAPGDAP